MKKKLLLCALMIQISSAGFAQSASADINSMLSSWVVPLFAAGLLIGFGALCWQNQDALRGKNGLSKQDGWFAIGEGMIFIVVVISAISFIAGKVTTIVFKI